MSFSIDVSEATTCLRKLITRLDDLVPLYDAIGGFAVKEIENRIMETKVSPDGVPWAPWRPFTEHMRSISPNYGRGINWETGAFLQSVKFSVDGNFEVIIESDSPYGEEIQEGNGRHRAARPVMGWNERDLMIIQRCALNYFETGSVRI